MKVFISHSHEDTAIAAALASELKAHAWEPFTSLPLEKGADWKSALSKAISESQAFVILSDPGLKKAVRSKWNGRPFWNQIGTGCQNAP